MKPFKSPAFFAGLAVGILLLAVGALVMRGSSAPVYAASPIAEPIPQAQAGFMMTPGTTANGNACLWVIDTHASDKTPCLAFYTIEGGNLKLQAVRRIKYDFTLLQYNDATPDKYSPAELKKMQDEMAEKEAGKRK